MTKIEQAKISSKIGLPPGALVHLGKRKMEKAVISIFNFSKDSFEELQNCNISDIEKHLNSSYTTWINVDGVHDKELIEEIGKLAQLHSLLLEEIMNTYVRPKFEDHGNRLYFNLKMLGVSPNRNDIIAEQVGIILGHNFVISFQEKEGDLFEPLRDRLRENKGLLRVKPVDYFFYRLVDTIVDNYFLVSENITERTEELEKQVLESATPELLKEIQKVKKTLIRIRRMTIPLREAVSSFYKEDSLMISADTKNFIRDVYDHLMQLIESGESQREMITSIMELYHTEVSNRMNQVMQLLTVISTIFIPITFIAGIYGMNFDVIPELEWEYGYYYFWALVVILVLIMLYYFKKKKWF